MKKKAFSLSIAAALTIVVFAATARAQTMANFTGGGEVLNENQFFPVPQGMTFEEYQDATRRVGVGLLLAFPVPGMVHFYANEPTKGWYIFGTAMTGIASVLTGAILLGVQGKELESTDYDTVTFTYDGKSKTYEKIPVSQEVTDGTTDTTYVLRELEKNRPNLGGGGALLGLGILAYVGAVAYDILDGIWTIEEKRDKVRYKYGLQSRLSVEVIPEFDPERQSMGMRLGMRF